MGKKISLILVVFSIILFQTSALAKDNSVTLNELIENSQVYDNQLVRVSGEVLLEAMEREEGTWVNINDGTNAMGLFIEGEEASTFKYYGNYQTTGDTVEVDAIFHRSCPEHGGDMDLHLVKLVSVTPGQQRSNPINYDNLGMAFMLTGFTLLIVVYNAVHTGMAKKLIKKLNIQSKR